MSTNRPDDLRSWVERRKLYVQGLLARVFLALSFGVIFVALGVAGLVGRSSVLSAAAVLVALALVNVPYWVVGARRGFPTRDFAVHWAVDIVLLTVMIHFAGGINTPYCGLAYSSLVMFGAVTESRAVAMRLAALSMASFALLVMLEATGLVESHAAVWGHRYGPGAQFLSLVAPFIFVFELGWLGGTLADQLKAANASLAQFSARIEEQNRLLEHRVTERTAELERANQEIEDLVHIVTHDLKNVSVATTETARKLLGRESAGLTPRGRKYAENLLEDGRSMSRMLENLLSLFREADPEASKQEWVDVGLVVRQAFDRLQHQVESKAIEVVVGALPAVFAEPAKIRHIFDNLIDNACKYVGESKPPRIEVGGSREGGQVTYFVRDNGIGIDTRQVGRIFQLYHRSPHQAVDGITQTGHGVGLAIVKRIVERHGGRLWVASKLHRGSTFFVSLPAGEKRTP